MPRALQSRGHQRVSPEKLQCYSILTIALLDTHHGVTKCTRATPVRLKFIQHLYDVDVLVLDDFLTIPIDAATGHQLLNILAEREGKVSAIVTSQFTPLEWYKSIPDAVISESILNRLVSGAEIITLEGPNMRLTTNA